MLHVIRTEEQFQALGDEFMKLDAAYSLRLGYGVTFEMFTEKPWYYRQLTELMHDGGTRPLLTKQRVAALKADHQYLRDETRRRLHFGAIFERLYHHRHPRNGTIPFTRKQRT